MNLEKSNSKINGAIETALKNINGIVDVNTVVGTPIKTEGGEYIVPFSNVTIGVLVGGGEYGKIGIFKKGEDLPYSAGNGALISIKPCGFLVKEEDKFKMLVTPQSTSEKIIDKANEFIRELQEKQ